VPNTFITTGHNILLKVKGEEVGAARSIVGNQDFGVEGAYVIGSILPVENTPQKWTGNLEIDKFFIKRDIHLLANVDTSSEGVLEISPVDIEIIEKETGSTVMIYQGCTLTSTTITITANAYVGERAVFVPLRVIRAALGKSILPPGV